MVGIDISHFSGAISVNQFREALVQGVQFIIIGLQDAKLAVRNYHRAKEAGIPRVDVYDVAPLWTPEQLPWIERDSCYWIDIERPSDLWRLAELKNGANEWIHAGYRVGIYTGKGYWDQYLPGNEEFSSLPLWDAHYVGFDRAQAILANATGQTYDFEPYGGWQQASIWQFYGSNRLIAGIHSDLNLQVV